MRTPKARRRAAAVAFGAIIGAMLPSPIAVAAPAECPSLVPSGAASANATVLVYGGTPAGVMAAVAARRSGASVLLLEPTMHVGGMMTSGLNATDLADSRTLGGITREFFTRVQAIEANQQLPHYFQSRNAECVFNAMLTEAGVDVRLSAPLTEDAGAVTVSGGRIVNVRSTGGRVFGASVFIDASYAGDLMARAGVDYVIGREASSHYGEDLAGVRPPRLILTAVGGTPLPFPLSPPGPIGSADTRIQDSNFRLCFSIVGSNQEPFREPAGYVRGDYEIVARYIAERTATGATPRLSWLLTVTPTANGKYDVNDAGVLSIAIPGANYAFPDGSYATRVAIVDQHRRWTAGFIHFLRYDPSVPQPIRDELAQYGLCADEFTDNANWPYQLYLREGRRMVGATVLTAEDILELPSKPDIIGIASYRIDSHLVSRWVDGAGNLVAEGTLGSPSIRRNYAIPYRAMLPREGDVTNLLVSVTASASHVAFSSLRMEPHYMFMGEAAGTAAVMAAGSNGIVRNVDVARLQSRLRAAGSNLTDPGDIGASPFYGDIVWAYREGIISGCGIGRFCPNDALSREQMAAFLVRALDLPPATRDYFTDDEGSTFADQINRLAESGITKGCTPTTYCPKAAVTREQMASFLSRAFDLPRVDTDFFSDDAESIHQVDINRLAASGITAGCGGTLFCPERTVTRGEMIAFLHRALD